MSATLQTVGGPMNQLSGRVLIHEHIRIGFSGANLDPRVQLDMDGLIDDAARQLADLRTTHGVTLLVDATPPDLCRDTVVLQAVSARSGVAIVAATGMYRHGLGYPGYWATQDEADLEELFTHELTAGTESPSVRCGIIKIATSGAEPTPEERRSLAAAARVAERLDVRILTHTDPDGWRDGNPGLRQLEIIVSEGTNPSRVVIGHACGAENVDQLRLLTERGAYVGFDRVGMDHIKPDSQRAQMIAALATIDQLPRVLLSHDHQHHWVRLRPHAGAPTKQRSFSLLFDEFLPELQSVGLTAEQREQLLCTNPTRFLLGDGAGAPTS